LKTLNKLGETTMNAEPELTTENKIEETTNSENTAESDELSPDAIKRLARSKELRDFYRALAAVQTSVTLRVRKAKNEEVIKKMLKDATARLEHAVYDKCNNGQVWDPVLGKCVDAEPSIE
jgi:hypothetical protein